MKRIACVAAALLAVAGSSLSGSAVPVPVFASGNVELLANIPDPGAIGGRFAKIGSPPRTYFFTTGVSGLRVYDASVPNVPVLIGTLPLAHEENEDVDLSVNRGILLVSQDSTVNGQGALYVIDIAILPNLPRLLSVFPYPRNPAGRLGTGHIANCILDCQYAWVTGGSAGQAGAGGYVLSVDLTNPSAPTLGGWIQPPAGGPQTNPTGPFSTGTIHDVNVDQFDPTKVWVTGSRGVSVYTVTTPGQAVNPGTPVASFDAWAAGLDTFILHNSLRPTQNLLLVTEEDWIHTNNSCTTTNQGRFQTYSFSGSSITPLAQFRTQFAGGTYTNERSPVQVTCSAHWFDYRASDGLVAIGWYNQGVRFLKVAGNGAITQVGYWLAPGTTAFAAYFHPDPAAQGIVYVADGTRGLDVLRFNGTASASLPVADPAAPAPPASDRPVTFRPSPVWGYACLVPAVSD